MDSLHFIHATMELVKYLHKYSSLLLGNNTVILQSNVDLMWKQF